MIRSYAIRRAYGELTDAERLAETPLAELRAQLPAALREPRTVSSRLAGRLRRAQAQAAQETGLKPGAVTVETDTPLMARVRAWRKEYAESRGWGVYTIMSDKALRVVCESRPGTLEQLAKLPGFGPRGVARWGVELLAVLHSAPKTV